ncbi:hypothetical protein Q604_UNBC03183G0001, partial [human gut metagenome]
MTEMDPAIEPVSDERPGRERSGRWDEGEGIVEKAP